MSEEKTNFKNKTVFVLGAGFTKAFASNAPLLKCDIQIKELKKKYNKEEFQNIYNVLSASEEKNSSLVDIEALLTRLHSGMPYDTDSILAETESKTLYEEVLKRLNKKISDIKLDEGDQKYKNILSGFAKYIITSKASCITSNYDLLLDQYLWDFKRIRNTSANKPYWHPDGGYGFYCKPASSLIGDHNPTFKDEVDTLLLKLHGSVNWRVVRGYKKPYPINVLIHDEVWLGGDPNLISSRDIAIHLESESLLIPPILDKTVLSEQSVIKVIWDQAYNMLSQASSVIFIGYSLPETDIAAKFLFREALANIDRKKITVVTNPKKDDKDETKKEKEKEFKKTYRGVISDLPDTQFSFDGALEWIKANAMPPTTIAQS